MNIHVAKTCDCDIRLHFPDKLAKLAKRNQYRFQRKHLILHSFYYNCFEAKNTSLVKRKI